MQVEQKDLDLSFTFLWARMIHSLVTLKCFLQLLMAATTSGMNEVMFRELAWWVKTVCKSLPNLQDYGLFQHESTTCHLTLRRHRMQFLKFLECKNLMIIYVGEAEPTTAKILSRLTFIAKDYIQDV